MISDNGEFDQCAAMPIHWISLALFSAFAAMLAAATVEEPKPSG